MKTDEPQPLLDWRRCIYPRKKSIREGRDPRVGEDKEDIKIGVSSETGAQILILKK